MLRKLAFLACVLLLARPAAAQTTVPTGTPITIEFDHEQTLTEVSFRALVDATIVKNFVAADFTTTPKATGCTTLTSPCFTYRATIPAVNRGTHVLLVRAFNELGQVDSAPLSFIAAIAPRAPGLPKISITTTVAGLVVEVR